MFPVSLKIKKLSVTKIARAQKKNKFLTTDSLQCGLSVPQLQGEDMWNKE